MREFITLFAMSLKYIVISLFFSLFSCGGTLAATQSMTANIAFDTALTLHNDSDINFGTVEANKSGTYIIDTSGAVTPSDEGSVLGGVPSHGQLTISGSTTQSVSVSTGGYTTDNGVTLSSATCSYDGGDSSPCDTPITSLAAPGAGKVLTLGVTAVVDGSQEAGTPAAPTFTVTVIYG